MWRLLVSFAADSPAVAIDALKMSRKSAAEPTGCEPTGGGTTSIELRGGCSQDKVRRWLRTPSAKAPSPSPCAEPEGGVQVDLRWWRLALPSGEEARYAFCLLSSLLVPPAASG